MASRRKVDSTTQHSRNRADNPDRRGQPTDQTSSEQSDSKPQRDAQRRRAGVRVVSEGTDQPTEGQMHQERVRSEKEGNRDKKLKYRVNAEGSILPTGKEGTSKLHKVGDEVELTQAEARKHQDAGVPLTLVEDQDSEDQEEDSSTKPRQVMNDAPMADDPDAA